VFYLVEVPRARSRQSLRELAGAALPTGLWCIFAVSQRKHLSNNLLSFLACLKAAGYNVVLVNNGLCSASLAEALLPYCHTIIMKPHGGRDFGGYQWATRFLAQNEKDVQQVIYCNDSIFIRPSTLPLLLERIKQTAEDYIGITETFEPCYHIQSWFFVASGSLFYSAAFQKYWSQYKPLSYRLHCIKRGELGVSVHLLKTGVSPYPLYTLTMIADLIFAGSLAEAVERLLGLFAPPDYDRVRETVQQITFSRVSDERKASSFLRHHVTANLTRTNTMNAANLVLLECSAFPFLKKDLVYRGQYFFTQIENAVSRWVGEDAEHVKEILAYFRARGSLRGRYSPSAILAHIGVI
jgi:hypothetical protein